MRFITAVLGCFLLVSSPYFARANHIKGGELFYVYKGPGALDNSSVYEITLKLYVDCNAAGPNQLIPFAYFNFFDRSTLAQARRPDSARFAREEYIYFDPKSNQCVGNPPTNTCYRIRWYQQQFTLPNNAAGYIVVFQNCCRLLGIQNLLPPSDEFGSTFTCEIPGTNAGADAFKNSNPQFRTNDAAAICVNNYFSYTFGVDELDGDSVTYALCEGYSGGTRGGNNNPLVSSPPYPLLGYATGYSGAKPLGDRCSIDPKTGLITGIAPKTPGQYVLTACVNEYRKGILLATSRKDIHVAVSDCQLVNASLPADIYACKEFNVPLENTNPNPAGCLHIWDFGDNSKKDTSFLFKGYRPHLYDKPGIYNIKLRVALPNGECSDSVLSRLHVFPGFQPGFAQKGQCILSPIDFLDTSSHQYGSIISRKWDLGDEMRNDDTISQVLQTTWKYTTPGYKNIQLVVKSNTGCFDTVRKNLLISEIPPLDLAFHDTLICKKDTLQLKALAYGKFFWNSSPNLLNENSATPLVFPSSTSYFNVRMEQFACSNTDSVLVRVVDSVSLAIAKDTAVCKGDTAIIYAAGNATRFLWSTVSGAPLPKLAQIKLLPNAATRYFLQASIGHCTKTDSMNVRVLATPEVKAGNDTLVCFGDTALLTGTVSSATTIFWQPATGLTHPKQSVTKAYPVQSTLFYLRAIDSAGCPRLISDSVLVVVNPPLQVQAGRDTMVIAGQSLQLNATGAPNFLWSPSTYLNNPSIASPITQPSAPIRYIVKGFDNNGCTGYDTLQINLLKALPDLYVPNAFVPTGRNPLLRPIPIGMNSLEYFRVYNRWGQLVYETRQFGQGWDGRIRGQLQETGSYVWMARGTDFTGRLVEKRGVALLIR